MAAPLIPPSLLQPLSAPKPGQPAPQLPGQPIVSGKGHVSISRNLPGTKVTPIDNKGGVRIDIPIASAAAAFRVQGTQENMVAFLTWINSFDRPGVLGPAEFRPTDGAGIKRNYQNDPAKLRQLQAGLARRGYPVQPTGVWDVATSSAVVRYKQSRGIHEPFKTMDGKWAITNFADEALIQQVTA